MERGVFFARADGGRELHRGRREAELPRLFEDRPKGALPAAPVKLPPPIRPRKQYAALHATARKRQEALESAMARVS